MRAFDWLGARGVSREAAEAWYRAHYRAGLEPERALLLASLGEGVCRELVVGDRNEPAIACEHEVPFDLAQRRGIVLVVRARQPVAVLDVGLGLFAYDFPDVRHLDLALRIADDGRSAEVRERAPTGTELVETPEACRARMDHEGGPVPDPNRPARLVGCDAARERLRKMVGEREKSAPQEHEEARRALAFAEASCNDRGPWTWRGERFRRERAPQR